MISEELIITKLWWNLWHRQRRSIQCQEVLSRLSWSGLGHINTGRKEEIEEVNVTLKSSGVNWSEGWIGLKVAQNLPKEDFRIHKDISVKGRPRPVSDFKVHEDQTKLGVEDQTAQHKNYKACCIIYFLTIRKLCLQQVWPK